MSYVIGQPIEDVITIKDTDDAAILGLAEDDFVTLEAFLLTSFITTALVTLTEIDEGQYVTSFIPTTFGDWALHYIYSDLPTYLENTKVYSVSSTAEIVVTMAGGTWTYGGDLSDPLQEVRFLIQDTDGDNPLFTDTEVSFALGSAASNSRRAAAFLVERLMARYSAMADTTELDLSVHASQLFAQAKILWESLNNSFSSGASVPPYAGGISSADVLVGVSNRDRVPGIFDRSNPNWRRFP